MAREDIQRRVALAGGNSEGVLVASLAWATADDLDLHVVTPGGSEISYQHKKAAGGELDVDMCVQGRHGTGKSCTEQPVENVVFADFAPAGLYKVYVQNFNFHANYQSKDLQVQRMQEKRKASKEEMKLRMGRDRPVLFEVLVKVESVYRLFRGLCTPPGKTHKESDVKVFEFKYNPTAKAEEDRLVPVYEAPGDDPVCYDFQQKLLEHSSDGRSLPRGRGQSAAAPRIGGNSAGGPAAQRSPGKPSSSSHSSRASQKARKAEEKKNAALATVRGSSRQTLLSKPAKALRELLSDVGASCRSCMEKGEFVDRLREEAGVSDEL